MQCRGILNNKKAEEIIKQYSMHKVVIIQITAERFCMNNYIDFEAKISHYHLVLFIIMLLWKQLN